FDEDILIQPDRLAVRGEVILAVALELDFYDLGHDRPSCSLASIAAAGAAPSRRLGYAPAATERHSPIRPYFSSRFSTSSSGVRARSSSRWRTSAALSASAVPSQSA